MNGRSRKKKDKIQFYSFLVGLITLILTCVFFAYSNRNTLFRPKAEMALNEPEIEQTIDFKELQFLKESERDSEVESEIKKFIENSSQDPISLNANSLSIDQLIDDGNGRIIQILVTNNEDRNVMIKNITLSAENIVLVNKPKLFIDFDLNRDCINMRIWNTGWSNARNIKLKIVGEEPENYTKLFGKDFFEVKLEELDYSKNSELILFSREDVIYFDLQNTDIEKPLILTPVIYMMYEDSNGNEYTDIIHVSSDCGLSIWWNNGGFGGAGGGESEYPYAVYIDTSQPKCSASLNIAENINPGDMLEMPLCIYVDRTCKFDYYISLEIISGKSTHTLKSKKTNITLEVPSI